MGHRFLLEIQGTFKYEMQTGYSVGCNMFLLLYKIEQEVRKIKLNKFYIHGSVHRESDLIIVQ